MASQLDKAQQLDAQYNDLAIDAQKSQRETEPAQEFDADGNVICINCGFEVGEKRLEGRPESARCIGCQTDKEFYDGRRR